MRLSWHIIISVVRYRMLQILLEIPGLVSAGGKGGCRFNSLLWRSFSWRRRLQYCVLSKTVIMPDEHAGSSMASMITERELREKKKLSECQGSMLTLIPRLPLRLKAMYVVPHQTLWRSYRLSLKMRRYYLSLIRALALMFHHA